MTATGEQGFKHYATLTIGALLMIAVSGVLFAGFRFATQVTAKLTAMQGASVLQTYPGIVTQQLTLLRDRLSSRAFTGQAIANLKSTSEHLTVQLGQLAVVDPGHAAQINEARTLWSGFEPLIAPIVAYKDQPYVESDEIGGSLSASGQVHYEQVREAHNFARQNVGQLHDLLAGVTADLQAEASADAARLRVLLWGGLLAALALFSATAWLQFTRARHERAARSAREQTQDIMKTVKEGFFLLDADYRVGAVWSDALTGLFGRRDFAGVYFEDLLRDLVPPATLATAMKYIKLLWGDRANENLIHSINPLGQLELTVESPSGGKTTRYVQFSFNRVVGDAGVKYVLVSVTDITSNVLLSRELQESQENANRQVDMLLCVMHIDHAQLMSFLSSTESSLQLVNSILKQPARTNAEFREKLAGLYRELHSIKGESTALGLSSVAERTHLLEDTVEELKQRSELSGSDFLPILLKLDELLAHLRSLGQLGARLSGFGPATGPEQATSPTMDKNRAFDTQRIEPSHSVARESAHSAPPTDDLGGLLTGLAKRLATEHNKQFDLHLSGVADIPRAYREALKGVLIQMVRNCAVHGIEPADIRQASAKKDVGTVRVSFAKSGSGFDLVIDDDGAGMSLEGIRAAAVRRGLLSDSAAATLDQRAALALIFRPGFSTRDEVSMDAGRGVGMDVVAKSIRALGGKIGISTSPGQYTRFRISLPELDHADAAVT